MTKHSVNRQMEDAAALLEAGDHSGAEAAYRKILSEFPDAADASFQLALIRYDQKDLAGAVSHFQNYLSLCPDAAEVHFNVGTLLTGLKRTEEAIIALSRALELRPDLIEAHNNLGIIYRDAGNLDLAEQYFRSAIAIDPNFVAALVNLGLTLTKRQSWTETIEVCRHACELNPLLPDAQLALGLALEQAGQVEEAEKVLAEAARLKPDSPVWKYHLAATRSLQPPPAAPAEYVAGLFDAYAPRFDEHLRGPLRYKTPERILEAVRPFAGNLPLEILDLGCGTGLCGEVLKPLASRMTGIDLSAGMIAEANARGCYDELRVSSIEDELSNHEDRYDLIVASDVFIYVGDLSSTFSLASRALREGGYFAFSVEAADGLDTEPEPPLGYRLNKTRRYAHTLRYLQSLAGSSGFTELSASRESLRVQAGQDVVGWILVLRRNSPQEMPGT